MKNISLGLGLLLSNYFPFGLFPSLVVLQTFLVSPFASRFYELGPLLSEPNSQRVVVLLSTQPAFFYGILNQIDRSRDDEPYIIDL